MRLSACCKGPAAPEGRIASAPQPPGVRGSPGPLRRSGSHPQLRALVVRVSCVCVSRAGFLPALFLNAARRGADRAQRDRRAAGAPDFADTIRAVGYLIAAKAAPRIVRGFSVVPLCTNTAASSMPSPAMVCTGTVHDLD